MPTTLAVRFPLGRYHANPWNRAVNEGASEWPPSPWRILRALVATWHTRWPDLPEDVIDGLLDDLADPPSYRTPPARPGHTRHYLPDLSHRKAETGNTDLTLDPFLSVPRDAELFIHWDKTLSAERIEVLTKLAELLPYLGRAESVCEARLAEETVAPDETWWRPEASANGTATRRTRLLAPNRPLDRSVLEATTGGIRKQRRTLPPGTTWVTYTAAAPRSTRKRRRITQRADVTAIRFAVTGRAPMMATHGVLLADEAHRQVGHMLEKKGIPDDRRKQIMGTKGAASNHQHAHWIPLSEDGIICSLVVWIPCRLRTEEVAAMLSLRTMSGKRGGEDGYELRGFPRVEMLFQAAGGIEQVAPELCGPPASRWRTVTPYLPVRHQKHRESYEEHLAADVAAELRYRGRSDAMLARVEPDPRLGAQTVNRYRRYRPKEKLRESRTGIGLVLEFDKPVTGPLILGQLSHFGFGVFQPER
ncbi:MAG: type I-U CRISPR-associated protein Cas5/Cas6 [Nocardiopsaceae bacterium]|nr:type I-U CRISPR-associated protein Cas5/Cas6 [Nocardiopsaceae bacterium]